jgi:hypothetical protein
MFIVIHFKSLKTHIIYGPESIFCGVSLGIQLTFK